MKKRNQSTLKWLILFMMMETFSFAATLDWSAEGWTSGDLSQNYINVDGSGIDISVAVTGDTNRLGDNSPKIDNNYFYLDANYRSDTESVTVTFRFSVPVKLSSLKWMDIDSDPRRRRSSNFDDRIIVTAKDADGNAVAISHETFGSAIDKNSDGDYESDNSQGYTLNDSEAQVTLDYATDYSVTELSFIYTNGDDVRSNPREQAIWFNDITFEALDTDNDGVADFRDIDDDNDGILDVDEYTITETDSYAGGDSGSTHSYDYTYFSTTLVTVDFYKIDNSFNLNIDGTSILVGNKIVDLQEASTSTSSKMLFSDGGAMSQPWKENNNGTPRVRVIIDETGKVTVYATRTKSSTSYEMLHTEDGTAFNTLYFAAGTHTLTVENPDGPGPDAIKATNAVRAMDDNDNDGFINSLDLDSDNDGIPDNIEGQSTDPYNTPSGTVTAEGLWDDYGTGLIPLDTDGDDILDFLDSDSDNDGYTDCEEGNNNANANANCTNIVVGNNGMASWADSGDDYSDVNGNVNEPNPDSSGNLADEVSGNNEAAYREFLCGKALITLSHYKWRLISFPCDTGKNSIMELLGDSLGTNYGTDWEMWEQDGSDNYEVSATHKNTNKTKMNETDPIVQGKSYWIIINAGGNGNTKKVTIPKTGLTYALSPTATDDSSSIGISNTNFTKVSQFELPKASSVNVKKYMAGNPFPFSFDMTNLYFRHNSSGADYYAMGNANNDDYINNTVYKHDSNKTGPVNGYTAVVPSTPGFNAPILPMEGFFIKIETNSDTSNSNNFAYPLSMGNDK